MWLLNPRGASPLRSGVLLTELAACTHQHPQRCSTRGRSLSVSAAQHSTRIRSGRRFVVEGPRSIGVIGSYRWNGNISTSRGQGRRYRSTQPAPADRGALLRRMARYIEEDPGAAEKLGKAVSTSNARNRVLCTPAVVCITCFTNIELETCRSTSFPFVERTRYSRVVYIVVVTPQALCCLSPCKRIWDRASGKDD